MHPAGVAEAERRGRLAANIVQASKGLRFNHRENMDNLVTQEKVCGSQLLFTLRGALGYPVRSTVLSAGFAAVLHAARYGRAVVKM